MYNSNYIVFMVHELFPFLPLLRCFNPAEPVVEKSVILSRVLKCLVSFPACCQIGNWIGFWNKVCVK
jgi:hypothetical protein